MEFENNFYNETTFPASVCRCDRHTMASVPAHWHDEFEFILVKRGSFTLHVDDESVEIFPGDIALVMPLSIHSLMGIKGDFAFTSFTIHPKLLCPDYSDVSFSTHIMPLLSHDHTLRTRIDACTEGYEPLRHLLTELERAFDRRDDGFEFTVKGLIFLFFGVLDKCGMIVKNKVSHAAVKNQKIIHDAIEYIAENYSRQITIDEIAEYCHYSRSYLMSVFKKYVGYSVITYINRYRLDKAASLLLSTNEPIIEIAMRCGFNNISFFGREFKKSFGFSPVKYRKHYSVENKQI